jgi:hypothetical protein
VCPPGSNLYFFFEGIAHPQTCLGLLTFFGRRGRFILAKLFSPQNKFKEAQDEQTKALLQD